MPYCYRCEVESEPDAKFCHYCGFMIKESNRDSENMIKGRIAETLIEELFITNGYHVHRFGMENTMPGLKNFLYKADDDRSKKIALLIRKMPDFVVQKGNALFFIEVKYRYDETFDITYIGDDYPYENVFFIIVSNKHIKCITTEELENGNVISANTGSYLGHRPEFQISTESITKFRRFSDRFYSNGDSH